MMEMELLPFRLCDIKRLFVQVELPYCRLLVQRLLQVRVRLEQIALDLLPCHLLMKLQNASKI